MNASGWSASAGVLCILGALACLFAFNPWGAVICILVAIVFFWLAHAIAVENAYYDDTTPEDWRERVFNR